MTLGAALSARPIDLHLHSTASDGTAAPEAVVASAVQVGLRALALTDHDTVEGIAPALVAANAAGIEFVPGVELTTLSGHLLALWVDEPVRPLRPLAERRRRVAADNRPKPARTETRDLAFSREGTTSVGPGPVEGRAGEGPNSHVR